jgi:RNA polymerase sigma factor (sigma-70 family)
MTTDPTTWVDAYGDRLFRYALSRVRDAGSAEDLVQETLLAALKSRERFKGDSSELTWMTGILRNKIFEFYRRQAREVPLLPSDEDADPQSEFFDDRHWKAAFAPRDWGGEPARGRGRDFGPAPLPDALRRRRAGLHPARWRACSRRRSRVSCPTTSPSSCIARAPAPCAGAWKPLRAGGRVVPPVLPRRLEHLPRRSIPDARSACTSAFT